MHIQISTSSEREGKSMLLFLLVVPFKRIRCMFIKDSSVGLNIKYRKYHVYFKTQGIILYPNACKFSWEQTLLLIHRIRQKHRRENNSLYKTYRKNYTSSIDYFPRQNERTVNRNMQYISSTCLLLCMINYFQKIVNGEAVDSNIE